MSHIKYVGICMTCAALTSADCATSAFFFHFSFEMQGNGRALHEYTRMERKKAHRGEGSEFDGELDDFTQPELSSLVRLVGLRVSCSLCPLS